MIAEKSGVVSYMDLVDGVSLAEIADDATGITSKSVLDWRSQSSKNAELKPRITLRDEKGNVIKKLTKMKLDITWYLIQFSQ